MFEGFYPESGDFFWQLCFNNEKTWFTEHKGEFERLLNTPIKELGKDTFALVDAAYPELELELHVSRIYRDARRLHGRGPYKDNLWLSIKNRRNGYNGPSFFFEISPRGWCYGMGFWCEKPEEMENFRKAVAANPAEFERIALPISQMEEFSINGEEYKRPKGDFGPVVNAWYNKKHVSVICRENLGGDLYSPKLAQRLADAYIKMMPMYIYLNRFCGENEK